jgi:hypothetical protein
VHDENFVIYTTHLAGSTVRVVKSLRLRWGHKECIQNFGGETLRKRALGRPRRWEDAGLGSRSMAVFGIKTSWTFGFWYHFSALFLSRPESVSVPSFGYWKRTGCGLLSCYTVWPCRCISTFQRNMLPPSSGWSGNLQYHTVWKPHISTRQNLGTSCHAGTWQV